MAKLEGNWLWALYIAVGCIAGFTGGGLVIRRPAEKIAMLSGSSSTNTVITFVDSPSYILANFTGPIAGAGSQFLGGQLYSINSKNPSNAVTPRVCQIMCSVVSNCRYIDINPSGNVLGNLFNSDMVIDMTKRQHILYTKA